MPKRSRKPSSASKPSHDADSEESASTSNDEEFVQQVEEEDVEEIASDEELTSDAAKEERGLLEEEAEMDIEELKRRYGLNADGTLDLSDEDDENSGDGIEASDDDESEAEDAGRHALAKLVGRSRSPSRESTRRGGSNMDDNSKNKSGRSNDETPGATSEVADQTSSVTPTTARHARARKELGITAAAVADEPSGDNSARSVRRHRVSAGASSALKSEPPSGHDTDAVVPVQTAVETTPKSKVPQKTKASATHDEVAATTPSKMVSATSPSKATAPTPHQAHSTVSPGAKRGIPSVSASDNVHSVKFARQRPATTDETIAPPPKKMFREVSTASQKSATASKTRSVAALMSAAAHMSMPQLITRRSELLTELRELESHDTGNHFPQIYGPFGEFQKACIALGKTTVTAAEAATVRKARGRGGIQTARAAAEEEEEVLAAEDQEAGAYVETLEMLLHDSQTQGSQQAAQFPSDFMPEPQKAKSHWDFLLEEMQWMATEFQRERKMKMSMAKKLGSAVGKRYELQAKKRIEEAAAEELKKRRRAGRIAHHVEKFWQQVDKLVVYKHQSRLEAMKRMAMDKHLNFLVGQTERYSALLATNITAAGGEPALTAAAPAPAPAPAHMIEDEPAADAHSSVDEDEEDGDSRSNVYDELQRAEAGDAISEDSEFTEDEEEEDDEETLEEEERQKLLRKQEKGAGGMDEDDDEKEASMLEAEADMPLEELLKRYGYGADADDGDEDEPEETKPSKRKRKGGKQTKTTEPTSTAEAASKQAPQASQSLTGHIPVPFLLNRGDLLRVYQREGLDWLVSMHDRRLNGILADEMGLGKTIQTISLLAHLAANRMIWGPHLIVVPTSTILNWEMEFRRWCPALKVLTYYGNVKDRKAKRIGWTKPNAFHVCVTSYQMVLADSSIFRRKRWYYMILDEAHYIKNYQSQRWQTLLTFSTRRRLLLTGTPLQNSLMELWSLMHFLMPHLFRSQAEFKTWFANPLTQHVEGGPVVDKSLVQRLHAVLRPFVMRRLKADVATQMPKKYEHVVMCQLSRRQRFLYEDFMSRSSTRATLSGGNFMSMMNVLMQLRKVCNHPDLFEPRPILSPFECERVDYVVPGSVIDKSQPHQATWCGSPIWSAVTRLLRPRATFDLTNPATFLEGYSNALNTNYDPLDVYARCSSILSPPLVVNRIDDYGESVLGSGFNTLHRANPFTRKQIMLGEVNKPITATLGTGKPLNLPDNGNNNSVSWGSAADEWFSPGFAAGISLPFVSPSNGFADLESTALPATFASTIHGLAPTADAWISPAAIAQAIQARESNEGLSTTLAARVKAMLETVLTRNQLPPQGVSADSVTLEEALNTLPSEFAHNIILFHVVRRIQSRLELENTIIRNYESNRRKTDIQQVCPVFGPGLYEMASVSMIASYKRFTTHAHPLNDPAIQTAVSNTYKAPEFITVCPITPPTVVLPHMSIERTSAVRGGMCSRLARPWEVLAVSELNAAPGALCASRSACAKFMGKGVAGLTPAIVEVETPGVWACYSSVLRGMVQSQAERYNACRPVIQRFGAIIPKVRGSLPRMLTSNHPTPPRSGLEPAFNRVAACMTAERHDFAIRKSLSFPDRRLVQFDCGKLQALDKLLRERKAGNHRCLIFTQMTRMLDVLETFLNLHDHTYLRLDGATKVEDRQRLMDRFNRDPKVFVFILSTRSGGLGINLVGADTVIFYDSDWNPAMDAQAQDRAHRIGQTRDVHIYRLISEATVEENILMKARQKRALQHMSLEEGQFTMDFFQSVSLRDLVGAEAGSAADAPSASQISASDVAAAMAAAEDDVDVEATGKAAAESREEMAEFDESAAVSMAAEDSGDEGDGAAKGAATDEQKQDKKQDSKAKVNKDKNKKKKKSNNSASDDENSNASEDVENDEEGDDDDEDENNVEEDENEDDDTTSDESESISDRKKKKANVKGKQQPNNAKKQQKNKKKVKFADSDSEKDAASDSSASESTAGNRRSKRLKAKAAGNTKMKAKSRLDIDLDELKRQTAAEELGIDVKSAGDNTPAPISVTAAFNAALGSAAPEAAPMIVRDRVAIAAAKFAEIESKLQPAEKYAFRYRESRDPHPWVEPEVLRAVEESFHMEEKEWEVEQLELLKEEEEAKAEADAELLQLHDDNGEAGVRGVSAEQAGAQLYQKTLQELRRGIKIRAITGAAWEERIDEGSRERYYFNTDTQEASWEKPLVLRQVTARKIAQAKRWESLHRLPAVGLNIMRFLQPKERVHAVSRVCRSWRCLATHPSLMLFVKQKAHAQEELQGGVVHAVDAQSLITRKPQQNGHVQIFTELQEAINAATPGATIVVGFGSHYVDRSIVVNKNLRIISQGVRGAAYAGFETADAEWIFGPHGEWYPALHHMPPSIARSIGYTTGYLNDAGFVGLGASLTTDMSVADSAVVRINGNILWHTPGLQLLQNDSSTMAPPLQPRLSQDALIMLQYLGASPAGVGTSVRQSVKSGGGQIRGLTIRNISPDIPYCLVVVGDGQLLYTALPPPVDVAPAPVPAETSSNTPATGASGPTAAATVAPNKPTVHEATTATTTSTQPAAVQQPEQQTPRPSILPPTQRSVSKTTTVLAPALEIYQCDLANKAGFGACVYETHGANVVMAACRVSSSTGSGVLLHNGSFLVALASHIVDCGGCGVSNYSGTVLMRGCTVSGCGGVGVSVMRVPPSVPDGYVHADDVGEDGTVASDARVIEWRKAMESQLDASTSVDKLYGMPPTVYVAQSSLTGNKGASVHAHPSEFGANVILRGTKLDTGTLQALPAAANTQRGVAGQKRKLTAVLQVVDITGGQASLKAQQPAEMTAPSNEESGLEPEEHKKAAKRRVYLTRSSDEQLIYVLTNNKRRLCTSDAEDLGLELMHDDEIVGAEDVGVRKIQLASKDIVSRLRKSFPDAANKTYLVLRSNELGGHAAATAYSHPESYELAVKASQQMAACVAAMRARTAPPQASPGALRTRPAGVGSPSDNPYAKVYISNRATGAPPQPAGVKPAAEGVVPAAATPSTQPTTAKPATAVPSGGPLPRAMVVGPPSGGPAVSGGVLKPPMTAMQKPAPGSGYVAARPPAPIPTPTGVNGGPSAPIHVSRPPAPMPVPKAVNGGATAPVAPRPAGPTSAAPSKPQPAPKA